MDKITSYEEFSEVVFKDISIEWKTILSELLPIIYNNLVIVYKKNPDLVITPPIEKIFEFARLTKLNEIKVCIIGQDPYPKEGYATGLAFSCNNKVPLSLKNIYHSLLKHKLINEMPTTGNLNTWAKQGVLLINRYLTTQVGKPLAHAKVWNNYVIHIIQKISETRPIIFMLWGNNAIEIEEYLDEKAIVMKWSHPSPMAQIKQSFADCDHFIEANKILKSKCETEIKWVVEESLSNIEKEFCVTPNTIIIFTDGSCYPNNTSEKSRGGYAAYITYGSLNDTVLYGSIEIKDNYATNQRAEGAAIYHSLLYLEKNIDKWDKLIFVTDSEFWINMFEKYMPKWAIDNSFNTHKNPDITEVMYNIYSNLITIHDKKIIFRHIKSHNKSGWKDKPKNSYEYFCYENNNYVDEYATYARKNCNPGVHKIINV